MERLTITVDKFAQLKAGQQVKRYVLANDDLRCAVLNYGAVIQQLEMRQPDGNWHNVVLGYDDLAGYLERSPYFGAICGRHAGRIRNAEFSVDEQIFQLEKNYNGRHNLHSGPAGLDKKLWQVKELPDGLQLSYYSSDGESGFPGNLAIEVYYRLLGNELHHHYYAWADRKTPVNLNNHSYFNLGDDWRSMANHSLRIDASRYSPLDSEHLFSQLTADVAGTPFDFRSAALIEQRQRQNNAQLAIGAGFDHVFWLDHQNFWDVELQDIVSGRTLRIHTDQPTVVFYGGGQLNSEVNPLTKGQLTAKWGAVCLETQCCPGSFQQQPQQLVAPGNNYRSLTIWQLTQSG